MSAYRSAVATVLTAALGDTATVMPYARQVDTISRRTVMLRIDRVNREPRAPLAERRYTFALVLLTPLTTPTGPADDDLDAFLDDVLDAIDAAQHLPSWTEARRAVYDERLPAYEVDLPVKFNTNQAPAE